MYIRLLKPSDAKSYWDLRLEALEQNPEAFSSSYEESVIRENAVEGVAENLANEDKFHFRSF